MSTKAPYWKAQHSVNVVILQSNSSFKSSQISVFTAASFQRLKVPTKRVFIMLLSYFPPKLPSCGITQKNSPSERVFAAEHARHAPSSLSDTVTLQDIPLTVWDTEIEGLWNLIYIYHELKTVLLADNPLIVSTFQRQAWQSSPTQPVYPSNVARKGRSARLAFFVIRDILVYSQSFSLNWAEGKVVF